MHDLPKKIVASAIVSELQSSDIHMTIKARLFDLKANLNGVRVTEGFLDEIVHNESKYQCIGLYADLRGLLANRTIGHMYNARTGEFGSTMIGSFYHYEKEVDGDNAYLVGYARLPKRNKAVCKAISELFADGSLKFSFEITCGEYTKLSDGTMVIDASEANYFEGEAVVTFPACEDAIALDLVAECLGKGDENMADCKKKDKDKNEAVVDTDEEKLEETKTEETKTETAETEVADRIIVHESHEELDHVSAYNCDTGEEVHQTVSVRTETCTPVETASEAETAAKKTEVDTLITDGSESTEEGSSSDTSDSTNSGDHAEETSETTASCKNKEKADNTSEDGSENKPDETIENNENQPDEKKTASVDAGFFESIMAELKSIKEELASMREKTNVVASAQEAASAEKSEATAVIAENQQDAGKIANPFMASMTVPKKYSLLEKEEKKKASYSLLERA